MTRMIRLGIVLGIVAVLHITAAKQSQAGLIASGTLSVVDNTLLVTNSGYWAGATLGWSVSLVDDGSFAGLYRYEYHFAVNGTGDLNPDLSHFTVEVSPSFTAANIFSAEPGPGSFEGLGNDPTSPAGIDGVSDADIFGLKWETSGAADTFTAVLISDRDPVWGDVFLKNGQVDAYNAGYFAVDPITPVAGAGFGITGWAWLATPDTTGVNPDVTPVPEPSSLVIFGLGALGWVGIRRQRMKIKRS